MQSTERPSDGQEGEGGGGRSPFFVDEIGHLVSSTWRAPARFSDEQATYICEVMWVKLQQQWPDICILGIWHRPTTDEVQIVVHPVLLYVLVFLSPYIVGLIRTVTRDTWSWSKPDERDSARPSTSSKNMMDGARSCASLTIWRSARSPSPTRLDSTSTPLRKKSSGAEYLVGWGTRCRPALSCTASRRCPEGRAAKPP